MVSLYQVFEALSILPARIELATGPYKGPAIPFSYGSYKGSIAGLWGNVKPGTQVPECTEESRPSDDGGRLHGSNPQGHSGLVHVLESGEWS